MSIRTNNLNNNHFMKLALQQAHKILGNTKENPADGCVIVIKNSVINASSTGFNGRPHAENKAFLNNKLNTKNSDLYVTLEPCVHYGKTPPCINQIIKK